MKHALVLLLGLISWSLYAQVHSLGYGLTVTDAQIQEITRRLPRTTQEHHFYHWTKLQTALRWSLNRHINAGEVAFYNQPTGNLQVYGPGIYMAESATSSKEFGTTAVVFTMPSGTPLYDSKIIAAVLGKPELNDLQCSELGKLIPFVRKIAQDWWVTNHPQNVSRVTFGDIRGASAKWDELRSAEILAALQEAARGDGGAQFLESLFNLSYYMDGISFYRALKVNPGNPWREFEPQNFEKYRKARTQLSERALKGQIGMSQGGQFGASNTSQTAWVNKQMHEVLPLLFEEVSGTQVAGRNYFRNEGIRAGGNLQGDTFLATAAQVEVLQKNPYVEVEATPLISGKGFLVHYFYPDVFHFKKLKDKLSPEFYQELEALNLSRLWNDEHLRQQYNQRIVTDLLKELLARSHGRRVDFRGDSVQFLIDLVSIHPFKDFNGRVTRLYYDLAHVESKLLELPYSFLADLDLLTNASEYQKILRLGNIGHKKMMAAMIKELLQARTENRAPNFRDLSELDHLWKALEPLGIPTKVTLDQHQLELIRKRRFEELFELIRRPQEINIGASCSKVFN